MNAKYLFTAVAVLAVLLASAVVFAHGGGYGWGHHTGSWWSDAPEDVRLSDSQLAKIDKIRDSYARRFVALQGELRDLDVAIYRELAKDEPNTAKLNSLREQRVAAYEKLDDLRTQKKKEVDSVLTEEQREYFGSYGYEVLCPHMGGYGSHGGRGHMGGMMGPQRGYGW